MKKNKKLFFISSLCLIIGFSFSLIFSKNVQAIIAQENMEGSPDSNENHFIWGIMSQLQTPDDPGCNAVAQAALLAEGISSEGAATIATEACNGIASMKTNMERDMSSAGESSETNLWKRLIGMP